MFMFKSVSSCISCSKNEIPITQQKTQEQETGEHPEPTEEEKENALSDKDVQVKVNFDESITENKIHANLIITPRSEFIDSSIVTVDKGILAGKRKKLVLAKNVFPIEENLPMIWKLFCHN